MDTIKIGGSEHEVKLLYVHKSIFLSRYNKVFGIAVDDFEKEHGRKLKSDDSLQIPPLFFFWVIWKCLVKKSVWPFKKPFRSMIKMIKSLEFEEIDAIISFVSDRVLGMPSEDKETGNIQ